MNQGAGAGCGADPSANSSMSGSFILDCGGWAEGKVQGQGEDIPYRPTPNPISAGKQRALACMGVPAWGSTWLPRQG